MIVSSFSSCPKPHNVELGFNPVIRFKYLKFLAQRYITEIKKCWLRRKKWRKSVSFDNKSWKWKKSEDATIVNFIRRFSVSHLFSLCAPSRNWTLSSIPPGKYTPERNERLAATRFSFKLSIIFSFFLVFKTVLSPFLVLTRLFRSLVFLFSLSSSWYLDTYSYINFILLFLGLVR